MGQEFLFGSLPVIGAVGFVAFIALGVAALSEAKHGGTMSNAVRRLYLYLVSFLTLLLVSTSVISLLDLGLRTTVFTDADPVSSFQTPPPTPYLLPVKAVDGEIAIAGAEKLTCEEETCTLTADQQTSIEQWTSDYAIWKDQSSPTQQRAELLVTAFSFLIIAGAAFVVHWLFARKDAKANGGESATRSTYLWAMSFVWLITSIVSLGFLLTTSLKAGFGLDSSSQFRESPVIAASNTDVVDSFATCGVKCGLSEETITLANEWKVDYTAWNEKNPEEQKSRSRQNALASQLAIVLIAIPLFGYHFMAAWKENRKTPGTPNAKLV